MVGWLVSQLVGRSGGRLVGLSEDGPREEQANRGGGDRWLSMVAVGLGRRWGGDGRDREMRRWLVVHSG